MERSVSRQMLEDGSDLTPKVRNSGEAWQYKDEVDKGQVALKKAADETQHL
jgi:hypothetical protein